MSSKVSADVPQARIKQQYDCSVHCMYFACSLHTKPTSPSLHHKEQAVAVANVGWQARYTPIQKQKTLRRHNEKAEGGEREKRQDL